MAVWSTPGLVTVPDHPTTQTIVVVNGYPDKGNNFYMPGEWHDLDTDGLVPVGTTAVGILARLQLSKSDMWQNRAGSFRCYSDPAKPSTPQLTLWKCRAPSGAKGQREQAFAWFQLDGTTFPFRWELRSWRDGMQASISLSICAAVVPTA